MRRLFLLAFALAVLPAARGDADDGVLDPSFGDGGIMKTGFAGVASGSVNGVVVQADGKILAAGSSNVRGDDDFAIARYFPDGVLDLLFGNGLTGFVFTHMGADETARAIVLQPDGKIVVAGSSLSSGGSSFALARYLPDGSLDTTFGPLGRGYVTTSFGPSSFADGRALTLQPDGKLVVAGLVNATGQNDFALARYNPDGSPDASFGPAGTGLVMTNFGASASDGAAAVAVQPDGRIVAAGRSDVAGSTDFAVARYRADGSLDPAFGVGGLVTTTFGGGDYGNALTLQPDGKIIVSGLSVRSMTVDFVLARYLPNGSLDTSFGATRSGLVTTNFGGGTRDFGAAAVLQPDGRILVAGSSDVSGSDDFALARYDAAGNLDPTFGAAGSGLVTTDLGGSDHAYAITLQPDGKIVAAGASDQGFALARYSGTPFTGCAPGASSLCLLENRFRVEAAYRDYSGKRGTGKAVALTGDTGYFWFFTPSNVEVVAKMVSFCGSGGSDNVGIYAGGLTDLEVTLTVTDTRDGTSRTYTNALGSGFKLIRDGPFVCP